LIRLTDSVDGFDLAIYAACRIREFAVMFALRASGYIRPEVIRASLLLPPIVRASRVRSVPLPRFLKVEE
jgi:hypothetical protein